MSSALVTNGLLLIGILMIILMITDKGDVRE